VGSKITFKEKIMTKNRKDYDKEYYIKNRDRILNRKKNDRWNDRIKHAKARANKMGFDFNLDREFLDSIATEYCPILNLKLSYTENTVIQDNSATIDRIDNTKGYTKDNIQILSYLANRMKSNASDNELLAFAKYFIKKLDS
jgi:hypothetical protein